MDSEFESFERSKCYCQLGVVGRNVHQIKSRLTECHGRCVVQTNVAGRVVGSQLERLLLMKKSVRKDYKVFLANYPAFQFQIWMIQQNILGSTICLCVSFEIFTYPITFL